MTRSTGERFAATVIRGGAVRVSGFGAAGAIATALVALGAGAVGAMAIGRLAIGKAAVRQLQAGDVHIRSLSVDELRVAGRIVQPSQESTPSLSPIDV
jgi:hypothetical protein